MNDKSTPFAFSQFVPGFDFLKSLAGGASGGASAVPGMPSLSSWVAPTLSVEEVDKRIQELKTVQYWLEQNGHALKATIQALEVQKMTLSTLRGMNVRMEDLANAFTRSAAATPSNPVPPPAPAPAPSFRAPAPVEPLNSGTEEVVTEPAETPPDAPQRAARKSAASDTGAAGSVIDPLQWWGALTQQFQQIASSALQEASQLTVPAMAQPLTDAVGKAMGTSPGQPAAEKTSAAAKKRPAKRAGRGAAKKPAASRKGASEK